jgi:hypothetical protein
MTENPVAFLAAVIEGYSIPRILMGLGFLFCCLGLGGGFTSGVNSKTLSHVIPYPRDRFDRFRFVVNYMQLTRPCGYELHLLLVQLLSWHLHFNQKRPSLGPYDQVWKPATDLMAVLNLRPD